MPRPCTTSWSRFPPRTREVQFDEEWAFVAKKQANCDPDDPADARKGDCWDHVALDPEHRLIVAVVPGKRTAANAEALVGEAHRRTSGRPMALITTDEYAPYREAILQAYGETITPPRTGRRGRPRKPHKVAPTSLLYATLHKTRRKGRVVEVGPRMVFGTEAALKAGVEAVGVEPGGEHVVRRAAARHRPQPQRAEGPQGVQLLEALGRPRGDHVLHPVQRQLLLAGTDLDRPRRCRPGPQAD